MAMTLMLSAYVNGEGLGNFQGRDRFPQDALEDPWNFRGRSRVAQEIREDPWRLFHGKGDPCSSTLRLLL